MKTNQQFFVDWEHHVFGCGYGSGELPILTALQLFLLLVPDTGGYDYEVLEEHLTPTVAWLLITLLIKDDKIDYGTSPRHGFLTREGRALRDFMRVNPADKLAELVNAVNEDTTICSPTHCNCDTDQPRCTSANPFWKHKPVTNVRNTAYVEENIPAALYNIGVLALRPNVESMIQTLQKQTGRAHGNVVFGVTACGVWNK